MSNYESLNRERWVLFPRAVLIGLCGGLVAVIFRMALESGAILRTKASGWFHVHTLIGFPMSVLLAGVTAWLAVWLVRRFGTGNGGERYSACQNRHQRTK